MTNVFTKNDHQLPMEIGNNTELFCQLVRVSVDANLNDQKAHQVGDLLGFTEAKNTLG